MNIEAHFEMNEFNKQQQSELKAFQKEQDQKRIDFFNQKLSSFYSCDRKIFINFFTNILKGQVDFKDEKISKVKNRKTFDNLEMRIVEFSKYTYLKNLLLQLIDEETVHSTDYKELPEILKKSLLKEDIKIVYQVLKKHSTLFQDGDYTSLGLTPERFGQLQDIQKVDNF